MASTFGGAHRTLCFVYFWTETLCGNLKCLIFYLFFSELAVRIKITIILIISLVHFKSLMPQANPIIVFQVTLR